MTALVEVLRALLRPFLRLPAVRWLRDRVRSWRRVRLLRRGLGRLVRASLDQNRIDPDALDALRRAWGNTGFTADRVYLETVAERARSGPGPFLDCGSGLSTLIAAALAKSRGLRVWSLEQDEAWYTELNGLLDQLRIDNVTLWYAPLRAYDDFVWYDLDGRALPQTFGCVFCDGPAVFKTEWSDRLHDGWRSGLVPVLRERSVSFGEIVLDDAEDRRCPMLIQRWHDHGLATRTIDSPHGSLVIAS